MPLVLFLRLVKVSHGVFIEKQAVLATVCRSSQLGGTAKIYLEHQDDEWQFKDARSPPDHKLLLQIILRIKKYKNTTIVYYGVWLALCCTKISKASLRLLQLDIGIRGDVSISRTGLR